MTGTDVAQIVGAALGGGALNHICNFWINKAKGKRAEKKQGDELMMSMWLQVSKEQAEWREQLRNEIKRLGHRLTEMEQENIELRRRNADLEARNASQQEEIDRLEKRIEELERDLRKHAPEVDEPAGEVA